MYQPDAAGELSNASAEAKFKEIFTAFYKPLSLYAFSILKDEAAAEEVVQEIFCRLWEREHTAHFAKATQAYLYKAVYHESLNQLQKNKTRTRHLNQLPQHDSVETSTDIRLLQEKATKALNDLPEQCRTIFHLSRFEQLKYKEIAERLGISIKTVEAQMSKALRILRAKLADYLPVLWICIIGLKR